MDVTGATGVDAGVVLGEYLDDLSPRSKIAASAPRGPALYRYLAEGEQRGETEGKAYAEFTEALLRELGIWWSPEAYRHMPVLTPWCVRDRSCRYDQGPESWGAPLPSGFLRDDNSIIKKLPLPLVISAPDGHPYSGRKPWRASRLVTYGETCRAVQSRARTPGSTHLSRISYGYRSGLLLSATARVREPSACSSGSASPFSAMPQSSPPFATSRRRAGKGSPRTTRMGRPLQSHPLQPSPRSGVLRAAAQISRPVRGRLRSRACRGAACPENRLLAVYRGPTAARARQDPRLLGCLARVRGRRARRDACPGARLTRLRAEPSAE